MKVATDPGQCWRSAAVSSVGEEVHLHPNAQRSCQVVNTYLLPAHFQLRFRGLACRVP